MRSADYPEIRALDLFIEKQDVQFRKDDSGAAVFDLISGYLEISKTIYPVYIDDEYLDLEKKDERIGIVLALREFEIIEESTDYLNWCTMLGIPANSEVLRTYYQESVKRIVEVRSRLIL